MCFTETPLSYSHVGVFVGETVILTCNTSADIMWTRDIGDGLVDYVYWNGRIGEDKRRLSVNTSTDDVHSLIISDVQLNESGCYDCYTDSGQRTVGYLLIVNGLCDLAVDAVS